MVDARLLDRLLFFPLRVVVGGDVLRPVVRAQRAHEDKSFDAGFLGGRDEVAGPLLHHALGDFGIREGRERDEVDHSLAALDCPQVVDDPFGVGFDGADLREVRAHEI